MEKSGTRGSFSEYLRKELEKYGSIMVPVKASLPERLLVKKMLVSKLHPNPDDEFSWPEIGPSYSIINKYVALYRQYGDMYRIDDLNKEPLLVEKVRPDGYMILNGHHRWAAYWMVGVKLAPVSIVNLTQETDIEKMIMESKHDKRATLDLDEVVFCQGDEPAEIVQELSFDREYEEKLRLGIPKLFQSLSRQGYDIWVYTSKYYSMDDISDLFKCYDVKVDGIITGTGRKGQEEAQKRMSNLLDGRYAQTLHIDRDMVLRTFSDRKGYEEYPVNGTGADWSQAVMAAVSEIEKNGKTES